MSTIQRDEWLKALSEAGLQPKVDDRDAVTVNEYAAMMQLDRQAARRHLEKLVTIGKTIRTTKRSGRTDGRIYWCVGYKLTP